MSYISKFEESAIEVHGKVPRPLPKFITEYWVDKRLKEEILGPLVHYAHLDGIDMYFSQKQNCHK